MKLRAGKGELVRGEDVVRRVGLVAPAPAGTRRRSGSRLPAGVEARIRGRHRELFGREDIVDGIAMQAAISLTHRKGLGREDVVRRLVLRHAGALADHPRGSCQTSAAGLKLSTWAWTPCWSHA